MENDLIRRKDAYNSLLNGMVMTGYQSRALDCIAEYSIPAVDAAPVVRCKECKYYELNSLANVNGIPLIVAHHICKRWGNGCKTDENGFCFMGEKVTE